MALPIDSITPYIIAILVIILLIALLVFNNVILNDHFKNKSFFKNQTYNNIAVIASYILFSSSILVPIIFF